MKNDCCSNDALLTNPGEGSYFLQATKSITKITCQKEFAVIPSVATHSFDYLRDTPQRDCVTRFLFVRHGESESNKNKGVAGRTDDSPLSEKGVQQAFEIHSLLAQDGVDIHAIYCSPMQRAIHTATYIADKEYKIDARLHEKFYGPVDGMSLKEYHPYLQKEESEIQKLNGFAEKFRYKPHPDFESMQEVCARVTPFILETHQKHKGECVLIGTHGGLMKSIFLLDTAMNGFETDYRSILLDNTAVFVVEVENEQISLKATTRLTHK